MTTTNTELAKTTDQAPDLGLTWREIVRGVLHRSRSGELPLAEIYEALGGHPSTTKNRAWQAAVRRVLLSD